MPNKLVPIRHMLGTMSAHVATHVLKHMPGRHVLRTVLEHMPQNRLLEP